MREYNNLLEATKRRAYTESFVSGRVGMDLRFKGYPTIDKVFNNKSISTKWEIC